MSGDYSRKTFKPEHLYGSVYMQQGRVQLDADWNEQQQIDDRRRRVQTIDTMGRAVVPRSTFDGFKIELSGSDTMLIHPGRMYVDGLLAENRGTEFKFNALLGEMFGTNPIEYKDQPFFKGAADFEPLPSGGPHIVYLKVWQRELTYVNEPDLVEPAVGVDTTARMQTAWQVRVLTLSGIGALDCHDEVEDWGKLTAPSAARLTTFSETADDDTDPCVIPISHGYRGLENQLYRVEVHDGGDIDSATFKWARDNASVETRVTRIDGLTITVQQTQWDAFRRFEVGKWVEVTDDVLEWRGLPGEMRRIEDIDYDKNTIELSATLPSSDFPTVNKIPDGERNTRVKLWNQSTDLADGGVLTIDGTVVTLEKGVQIQFSLDADILYGEFKTGDHWVFAARTINGSVEKLLVEPPYGIHYHYAKLAVVTFPASIDDDCREFWPLESGQNCCTVTVGDGKKSQGHVGTVKEALQLLPTEGGKICILPGDYEENVLIDGRQNITIEGCGGRSSINSEAPTGNMTEANPVIWIRNSTRIELKDLTLIAHATGSGVLVEATPPDPDGSAGYPLEHILLDRLFVNAATRSAVEVHDGRYVNIRHCEITMDDVPTNWPAVFVVAEDCRIERNAVVMKQDEDAAGQNQINGRGGIQIGGESVRVHVSHNHVHGGAGHGITLGSLEVVDSQNFLVLRWVPMVARAFLNCEPCLPFHPVVPPQVVEVEPADPDNPLSYASAGPLEDIVIESNHIHHMGMGGIGMAGFFNIENLTDAVLVQRLRIEHNAIHDCLLLLQAEITPDQINLYSYGAIALSVVEDLRVEHNRVENNGLLHNDPVCGIYALHVEGAEISHNHVVNNGARIPNPEKDARPGRRSGIHLQNVEVPLVDLLYDDDVSQILRQNGTPAAKIHDNTVVQPLGQALYMVARGPVHVSDNLFTSRGVMPFRDLATFAGTVFIVNLGLPEEFLNILSSFAAVTKGKSAMFLDNVQPTHYDNMQTTLRVNPFSGIPLANGNVQFSDNHCSLDLFGTEITLVWNSVLVLSLDDVAFLNNQCECSLDLLRGYDLVLIPNYVVGLTLRLNGNRFEEGLFNALLSAFSWGLFMHTALGNQATHCLWLRDALLPNRTRTNENTVFIDPTSSSLCERFAKG